ncbi:MAG: hypothetical protein JWM99_704, partial [Verrucomicrobiales bacterium]|nr:hypothetical protein [Verrucomicrobiales bacterium]
VLDGSVAGGGAGRTDPGFVERFHVRVSDAPAGDAKL